MKESVHLCDLFPQSVERERQRSAPVAQVSTYMLHIPSSSNRSIVCSYFLNDAVTATDSLHGFTPRIRTTLKKDFPVCYRR